MTAKSLPTVEQAVRSALRDARDADRLKPWHEPYAALALKFARQATVKDVSAADLARISTRIEALLAKLPLGEEAANDGAGAAPDRAGEGDTRPAGLASGVGSGPTVGDTALP